MWNQQGRFEMGFPLLFGAHMEDLTCRPAGVAYSEALLRKGDWKLGFYLHNHYRLSRSWFKLDQYFPEWQGEDLKGKTILVVEEGGHGDCFMTARYIPLLERAGAHVIMSVRPSLEALFSHQEWCGNKPDSVSTPDYWISCMSLPLHFGIVWEGPYIKAPGPVGSKIMGVGICHKAGAIMDGVDLRSMPVKAYRRLQDAFDGWHCDLTIDTFDWTVTANLISALDLVITVDTAVMHLAAAMGKPTWVALGTWSDWKFGLEGDRMPWYPTVRLFRGGAGGFDTAVDKILDSLKEEVYT